ncbi:MAG: multidrug efflux SMR transporter [Sphingobium sp.]
MNWLYLTGAILFEIVATSALKASAGFTRPLPTLLVLGCYAVAFYCLSLALRTISMGIAYAIWSGIGIVAISLIGWLLYRQALDAAALIGIGLIVAGTLVINLFSRAAGH